MLAAALLSRTFIMIPITFALFGRSKSTARNLTALYRAFLEAMPGRVVCLKQGEKVIAVMRIVEPGKCKTSKRQLFRLVPRLFMATGPRLPRVLKWLSFLGEHDPSDPHWHLGWFAVDPELQGKGIGSTLLAYFCEQVDRFAEVAYVVTTEARNIKLYERYGFSTEFQSAFFGVTHWFMKRPPAEFIKKLTNPPNPAKNNNP
jgi:ribosomal protein S18 acetylase RimI-like enzyme